MSFLDFFLVTCRTLHFFSAVAWIGGLAFLGGVAGPVFRFFGDQGSEVQQHIERRFVGFVWTTAWGLGISGALLMLLNQHFIWFEYHSWWSLILLGKQILFFTMVAASLVISKSHKQLLAPQPAAISVDGLTQTEIIRWRIMLLMRLNLVCGIVAIILAAMMGN